MLEAGFPAGRPRADKSRQLWLHRTGMTCSPKRMADELSPPTQRTRLVSLDALRGFDMMWIMGGDSIGGATAAALGEHHWFAEQLEHVTWEGCRFYDLIFPTFVFLAGVSAVFSLGRIREQSGKDAAFVRLLQRALMLYVLGLFYYGLWSKGFGQIRWLGVLQRIALSYLGAGFCFIYFRPRTLVAITITILAGYWAALTFIPVPGFGAGDLKEGHNLTNWIDANYLPGYKWDKTHDPEGLLSTFPAIATGLLGVFAGLVLRDDTRRPTGKALWLISYSAALLAAGYAFSFAHPIIKKLWTSSYVLVAAGWSSFALALFYYVIDVQNWKRWCTPFVWVGLNPITIYLACNLVKFDPLAMRLVGGPTTQNGVTVWHGLGAVNPGLGAFAVGILGIGWCFWLAWLLNRRRIYLRL